MGNTSSHSSSSHLDIDRLRHFSSRSGSLGLSRHELDKRCQPSGLYGSCQWEEKAIRRLIGDGKLAARQKGQENTNNGATEECPICFLNYTEVNTTTCCHANMCTECYLQVRPQKEKQSTCPFCACDDFSVVVAKRRKDFDLCPSVTSVSLSDSSGGSSATSPQNKSAASVAPHTPKSSPKALPKSNGFGSELAKDARFQKLRERTESFASSEGPSTPKKENEIIQSIAMTHEERQRLEEEMKAQHCHPLVLQMEAEAQERRLENDRAYQNSSRGQRASRGPSSRGYHFSRRTRAARNWEQFSNFFDHGEEIDDITALETAILYSRLAGTGGEASGSAGTNNSENNTNREQLDGFPLLRTLLTGQLDSNHESASSTRSLNLRSGRRQRGLRSGLGGLRHRSVGDVALGTATMMMRGISEEEQIAMAIAASMQDQQSNSESNENDNTEDNETSAEESNESSGTDSNSSNSIVESTDGSDSSTSDYNEGNFPALERQGSEAEESTITELARVVTDTRTSDSDSILNQVAA